MRTVRFQLALKDKVIDVDRIEWRKGEPYRAGYFDKELDKTHWFYIKAAGYTLRESTGLKDKNGVEIYEGDIVRTNDDWDMLGFYANGTYPVVFEDGYFGLKSAVHTHPGYLHQAIDYCEVIANIYENPELLTGGNDMATTDPEATSAAVKSAQIRPNREKEEL